MMNDVFLVLLTTAMTLGFVHTALGVDHSLPFIALARARQWSLQRTIAITVACGTLHVLSSVLIAGVGLAVGSAGQKLLDIEETRGNWAAWLLVGLGFAYAAVAFWRSRAPKLDGRERGSDLTSLSSGRLMPALFIIFALGPCEALLPLLTASGISLDVGQGAAIAAVFSLTTVLTMVGLVALGYFGSERLASHFGSWTPRLRQHAHTLAGMTLLASGLGIRFLGL
jgi:nickel/cobalt transporter (NicO) family protein